MKIPAGLRKDVPLAPLTTLGVGGPARFFASAESPDDVPTAIQFARERSLEVFILGGGSNVVFGDAGFDGLVLHVVPKGIENDGDLIRAAAGEDWDEFVAHCTARDLAGLECLSGIPGFVGGTPVQNVGAYGQEVAQTITAVRCYDRSSNRFIDLDAADCRFEYRRSIFNTTERGRYIVWEVTFNLRPGGSPTTSYKDLAERFAGQAPTLSEVRSAVLSIRRAKSMVIDPADPNSRSAGSFFKNPIVTRSEFDRIASVSAGSPPSFPAGEGRLKVPAAWLIENAGFAKGHRLGNAGISGNHSLAIVNFGDATASEILALKSVISKTVQDRFGIRLEVEPVIVPAD